MSRWDFKDESQVKEFIEKLEIEYKFGCFHEKKSEVCHLLGDYTESIKKEFDKAAKIYKENCENGNYGKSCYKYGKYRVIGKGDNDKGSNVDALRFFEKGCSLDEPESCFSLGIMLTSPMPDVKPDVHRGMESFKKSCIKGDRDGCYHLSSMYISGVLGNDVITKMRDNKNKKQKIGVQESDLAIKPDMKEAFKYAEKACELDNMYACANLSRMYKLGDGVEKNTALSEKFKQKALDLQEAIKNSQAALEFQQGLK